MMNVVPGKKQQNSLDDKCFPPIELVRTHGEEAGLHTHSFLPFDQNPHGEDTWSSLCFKHWLWGPPKRFPRKEATWHAGGAWKRNEEERIFKGLRCKNVVQGWSSEDEAREENLQRPTWLTHGASRWWHYHNEARKYANMWSAGQDLTKKQHQSKGSSKDLNPHLLIIFWHLNHQQT